MFSSGHFWFGLSTSGRIGLVSENSSESRWTRGRADRPTPSNGRDGKSEQGRSKPVAAESDENTDLTARSAAAFPLTAALLG